MTAYLQAKVTLKHHTSASVSIVFFRSIKILEFIYNGDPHRCTIIYQTIGRSNTMYSTTLLVQSTQYLGG